MFVMNLAKGFVEQNGKRKEKFMLTTYRNLTSLPIFRMDDFETREEAEAYIMKVEPQCPIITNSKAPINFQGAEEEIYSQWLSWLDERALLPTLSGFQHIPEHIARKLKGYPTSETSYLNKIEISNDD
jgi:hypothetical protein